MRFRDRIGNMLRAGGGALNGMLYDRLSAIEEKLDRMEQRPRAWTPIPANPAPATAAPPSTPSSAPRRDSPPDPSPDEKWEESRTFAKLIKGNFNPAIIYDIGAAEGEWSSAMSALFPASQFHLFDPLASLLPKYSSALEIQLQQHPNFAMHPVALGAHNGNITMSLKADGVSSTVFDMGDHPDYPQRQQVLQWRLDDFVERHSLPLPNLIKIDAQAAEFLILSHASRCLANASLVLAETWFDRGYGPGTPLITEISALLDLHGYQLVEIGHRFYDDKHRLYGCDAIYLKRDLLARFAPVLRSV
jgi:FkbM family methyltransferase